jgi:hypothetical protein
MAELPSARTRDLIAIEVADELVVQHTDGREVARLDRLAGQIWRCANGHRSVSEIMDLLRVETGGSIDAETVWSAIDRLADLDLLTQRITPPALSRSVSRRGILRVVGGAVGATATGVGTAFGQDRGELASKEGSAKETAGKRNAEQEALQRRARDQENNKNQQESAAKRAAADAASRRMQEEVNKSRK